MAVVGSAEIEFDLDTKGFDTQIQETEDQLNALIEEYDILKKSKPFEGQEKQLSKMRIQAEKLRNKLVDLRNQQNKLDYGNANSQLAQHDNSIGKIIKKVGKWALAVFGIRSAYQFVRQSANTIAQYDEKVASDLEYIRYALAMTIKPIVEWLIKAMYTILQYVGAIIYRITNYNIFKRSGVKEYEKSLKKSEKSSKKIKDNFTASFDEIEKVQKSESASSGTSGTGAMPSIDLGKGIETMELPKWAEKIVEIGKWIVDNKDTVLKILDAIGFVFVTGKVASWISPVLQLFGIGGGGGITSGLGSLLAYATSFAVIGYSIYDLFDGNIKQQKQLNDRSKKGLDIAKEDAKTVTKINDTEKVLLQKRKASTSTLYDAYSLEAQITGTTKEMVNQVKSTVQQQDEYLKVQIEAYKQGKLNKEDQEKLKSILKDQVDYLEDTKHILRIDGEEYGYINEYAREYSDILVDMGEKQYIYNNEVDRTRAKIKEITGIFDDIEDKKLPDKEIKVKFKTETGELDQSMVKLAQGLAKIMSAPLNAMGLGSVATNIKNSLSKSLGFKLASGGIINQPGKGVPLVSAIGGEAGREGVLPLTDESAMAQLGQEIGKYVNIENVINNYVDGRKLNQILAKSNNRDSFARNGA